MNACNIHVNIQCQTNSFYFFFYFFYFNIGLQLVVEEFPCVGFLCRVHLCV